jgi:hypothetical protein
MLAAKGYRCELKSEETGRFLRPPGAMLHDESGRDWPYTSVLFCSFSRNGGDREEAADDRAATRYFGYTPRAGRLVLPKLSIDDWTPLGEVRAINYYRPGGLPAKSNSFFDLINIWKRPEKDYRGEYEHTFEDGWFVFRTGLPRLFKLGRTYRLEFPPWAQIGWRGFVSP